MCGSMNAFMGGLGVICGARDVKVNKGGYLHLLWGSNPTEPAFNPTCPAFAISSCGTGDVRLSH